MQEPVPMPRAKSIDISRIPVPVQRIEISQNEDSTPIPTIIHVAEVHSTRKENKPSSSGDEDGSSGKSSTDRGEEKKKLKREGTFLVRHKSPVESSSGDRLSTPPSDKDTSANGEKLLSAFTSSKTSSIESIKLPIEGTASSDTPKPSSQIVGFGLEKKLHGSSVESIEEVAEEFKIPAIPMRRGSATETLSSSSDRDENKIKRYPLTSKHKKATGYATETLSEDSSRQNSPVRISSAPMPRPRQITSVAGTTVSEAESKVTLPRRSVPEELFVEAMKERSESPKAQSRKVSPEPVEQNENQGSVIENITTIQRVDNSPVKRASPASTESLGEWVKPSSPQSYCTSSSVEYQDMGVIPARMKKPKKKRKIKDTPEARSGNSDMGSALSLENSNEDEIVNEEIPDQNTVVCVTIHRCEPLRMKDLHKRPSVRVHLMDIKARGYRRSAFGRNSVDIVQTHPFDHIQNRSVVPVWDEDLILMEPVSHVVITECVIIFELLEVETDDIIAWAFLRPVAVNGKQNVGCILRLQLYKPVKTRLKPDEETLPAAFTWFTRNKLSPYRSTMLVSLHAIDSKLVVRPDSPTVPASSAPRNPTRRSSQMSSATTNLALSEAEKELIGVVWSRLPSLSCKLPNKIHSSLPAGPDGGMAVKYSRAGLLVACHTSNTLSVFTYRGSRYLTLTGHHGLVYDLSWSPDDSFLLSASADTTACVWNIKLKQTTPVATLSHPSYVYCCTWVGPSLVVTGCYDRALRLWDLSCVPTLLPQNTSQTSNLSATYKALHCAVVHKARVNTVAVLSTEESLVSGDSDGVLNFWKLSTTLPRQLELSREVKLRELRNQVINSVAAHPGGKRILVATRDSTLRMIDLQSTSVIQWFHGGVNSKLQNGSCFCGCGSRVLSCSEDGSVSVWDANTGERMAVYRGLHLPNSPATLSFHPKDNMFAIVSHKMGAFPSLMLSLFTRDASKVDMEIEWLDNRSEKFGTSSSVSDLSVRSSRESITERSTTRKKKKGILRSLLQGSSRSKTRKGVSNGGYTDTESGEPPEQVPSERRKRAAYKRFESLEIDGEVNHRLNDIIKRMDHLLLTASPSRSQVF